MIEKNVAAIAAYAIGGWIGSYLGVKLHEKYNEPDRL
jgi:uncharacterized membrane protein YfcA